MTTLAEMQEYLKILYYGPAGTCKTTSLASLANLGRIVYFNAEGGLKATALRQFDIPLENIEVKNCNTYDEYEDEYWSIKGRLEDGEPLIGVAFDSFTEIQAQLVDAAGQKRMVKEKKALTDKGKSPDTVDEWFTDRADYGEYTKQARKLIRMFRDLPCHVGVAALQKREVGDDGVTLVPQISPAFRADLVGYMDMVCCTIAAESDLVDDVDGIESLGIFRPVSFYRGKDRYRITPKVFARPTFDRLVSLLQGDLKLSEDTDQGIYNERMARSAEIDADPEANVGDGPEPDDEADSDA